MAPSIIRPTTANSTNSTASIFPMCIRRFGVRPPDYLAQPILGGAMRPAVIPQTAYIHPRITGDMVRYFEWMGAAVYTADRRAGAMHGKQFLLDSVHAGIDETYVYGRLDFVENLVPTVDFELVVNLESWAAEEQRPRRALRLDAAVMSGKIRSWKISLSEADQVLASTDRPSDQVGVALVRNFEFKLPLAWLLAAPVAPSPSGENLSAPKGEVGDRKPIMPVATKLQLRFSLWQNGLPTDALPVEGWLELRLVSQEDLMALW